MKWPWRWGKPPYLVVQDLRPFGYRIMSAHHSLRRARIVASRSRHLKVETREWVEAEHTRLMDNETFMRSCEYVAELNAKGLFLDEWPSQSIPRR